jgi:ATP-dependent DNA helicase RecQ
LNLAGIVAANIREDIHAVLRKHWGYAQFRPLQEDIINSVLEGHDTLALLPTGGGKSVCFQVPGLVLGGVTLVVSPLISLMNDQVENLKKKGISAVALTAAMSHREIEIALGNAVHGHMKFVYISPERLQNETFRAKLGHLPVSLIAVDEAHCISQWGYDFRPSYLRISEVRAYFPGKPVIALTASATGPVVEDIQAQLQFSKGRVFRQSFARLNLRYVVQHEENKFQRLLKVIGNLGGSGVVYVRNRRRTGELAKALSAAGVSALAYHAGMKYDDRKSVQDEWIANRARVIAATNAFGMGIDKPDVRFVVHLDLPDSLEAYFQEAGRAGRDGNTAYAALLYSPADQQRLRDYFAIAFPELDYIRKAYQCICNYYQVAIGSGNSATFDFDLERICSSYGLQAAPVYNSVKFLARENYFSLIDAGVEPPKVMITCSKEILYEYELRNPRFEPLIKTLLRSYGGLFESYVVISERELARRTKLGAEDVCRQLEMLSRERLIAYEPQGTLPKLVFQHDRVDAKYLYLDPANYDRLKTEAKKRIDAVIGYTTNDAHCRQVQLLRYFGESDAKPCGFCDVCLSKKPGSTLGVKESLLRVFEEGAFTLEQLKDRMKTYRDETWVSAFNEMVDDGILRESASGYALSDRARKR